MEFRRRFRLDHFVRRRMGAWAEISDPRDRPLRRSRRAGFALGHVRGQFALSTSSRRQARLFRARRRSRPASARSRCCSPTGTSRARRRCASPTTGNITAAARSRCGASSLTRRPDFTRAPTAGGICRSTAWASPKAISTARATRNTSSPRWATRSCRSSIPTGRARGEAPVYRDIAGEVGVTAHIPYAGGDKRPSTAWHAEFADFNNDGLSDIFVSKGNLEQMPDFAAYDPSNLLLGQWNGKFAEAGDRAGIACNAKGRGALIADFNLDGQLDILQINRGSNVLLWRNLGAKERRRSAAANGQLERNQAHRAEPQSQRGRGPDFDQDRNPQPDRDSSTSAAATPQATRASSMSASAPPSAPKSECNGPTATRAHPTACSPTSSLSSTARSRRPPTGIRGGSGAAPLTLTRIRRQLAITSFTCMIGSIFV